MTFQDRIRLLRKERGLTQAQIARELGVSTQSYSTYENGKEPRHCVLRKLSSFYECTIDYLLGISDLRQSPENTRYGINELAAIIHENAIAHGWWDESRSFPEIIALCHSELSEALEEYREEKPDLYYCNGNKPEGIGIELADCIIRILDYCGKAGIDIEEAIRIKHEYNKTRPYKHGGKKC